MTNFNAVSRYFQRITIVFSLVLGYSHLIAQTTYETIPTGSYIVNMGMEPQSFDNALKPYGFIWDLLANYNTPVKWVINPTKAKDGVDFVYSGTPFKGGPFIITEPYRTTTIDSVITAWEGKGMVGVTTTSEMTNIPVFRTVTYFMRWTLDAQNGGIAEGYLANAGIPATGYNWVNPQDLNCCHDVFAMPHADPEWSTHGNLYTWNETCKGALWAACHAVSALENSYNPANPSEQMNFLSDVIAPATMSSPSPWAENSVVLWGDHDGGTLPPPYVHDPAYDAHPVMQFLGKLDGAQENGSEQMYIPYNGTSWRSSTAIAVYDEDHPDVQPGEVGAPYAAKVVFGDGLGDANRGKVMYEAGHSHNKGSSAEFIAAQRAFFNFSFWAVGDKALQVSIGGIPNPMVNGVPYSLTAGITVLIPSGPYAYQWTASCDGVFSNPFGSATTFTPAAVTDATNCVISVKVTDACGRSSFQSDVTVIIPCPAAPIADNDDAFTAIGTDKTIAVLDNDNDPNGDPLTVTILSGPDHGTAVINGDGSITYSPIPNYLGVDTIYYQICDTSSVIPAMCPDPGLSFPYCDTAYVAIDVTDAPDPVTGCYPNQTFSFLGYGYADSVIIENGTDDPLGVLGTPEGTVGLAGTGINPKFNSATDSLVLYFKDIIPQGDTLYIYHYADNTAGTLRVRTSLTNAGYSNPVTLTQGSTADLLRLTKYVVTQAGGIQFIKFDNRNTNNIFIDAISYEKSECVTNCLGSEYSVQFNGNAVDATDNPVGSVTNPSFATGAPDHSGAKLAKNNADTLILELGDLIPFGSSISLYLGMNNTGQTNFQVMGSADGSNYSGQQAFAVIDIVEPWYRQYSYEVTQAGGVQYLKLWVSNNEQDGWVDAVEYYISSCQDAYPVVNPDTIMICEDNSFDIDVLLNDSDPLNLNLSVSIVTGPANGIASVNPDGTIFYQPNTDYNGTDQITYEACNTNGLCAQASVIITINPDSCPPGQSQANGAAGTLNLTSIKDSHISGQNPANNYGTCAGSVNGSEDGINIDRQGPERILLQFDLSSLPVGASVNSATLTLNKLEGDAGGWDATVHRITSDWAEGTQCGANGVSNWTQRTSTQNWAATGGDFDSQAVDTVNISTDGAYSWDIGAIVQDWANGTSNFGIIVKLVPSQEGGGNKAMEFASRENSNNALRPSLEIDYGSSGCSGPCSAIPNRAPLANNDPVNVDCNGSLVIDVQANDSDPDGNPLTTALLTLFDPPAVGNTVVLINTDSISFTPGASFTGVDTFAYSVCDGGGLCDTALVIVTIGNCPPTAEDDAASTPAGTLVTIDVQADNGNGADNDPEGEALTTSLEPGNPPTYGTAVLNGDDIDYTPFPGFTGTDMFDYIICDPVGLCDTATVTVTVTNTPPNPMDDNTGGTNECTSIEVDVLANDSDPDGGNLTVTLITAGPSNGTAQINYSTTISYFPDFGFSGTDMFTYQVCDDGNPQECATAVVTVNVAGPPSNQPPVAGNDVADATIAGQTAYIPVLDNDSDPEGTDLVVTLPAPNLSPAGSGTLSVLGNGMVAFAPAAGFIGTATFDYQLCDSPVGYGSCPALPQQCVTANVSVDVLNQAPIAIDDAGITGQDLPANIDVLYDDFDPDGDEISLSGVGTDATPSNGMTTQGGTVSINNNGTPLDPTDDFIDYTPPSGYAGLDTFYYQICDDIPAPDSLCDIAEVIVTITPAVDLEVSKSVNPTTANPGENVTFTITVTNTSTNTATGIILRDLLTSSFTYVSDDSGGLFDETSGAWNVGTLAGSGSSVLQITATVDEFSNSTNVAELIGLDQADTDSAPNNNQSAEDDQATVTLGCSTIRVPVTVVKN